MTNKEWLSTLSDKECGKIMVKVGCMCDAYCYGPLGDCCDAGEGTCQSEWLNSEHESDDPCAIQKRLQEIRNENAIMKYANVLEYDFGLLKDFFGDAFLSINIGEAKIVRRLSGVGIDCNSSGVNLFLTREEKQDHEQD